MSILAKTEILDLSVSERIQLAQDIWDSVAGTDFLNDRTACGE